MEPEGSLPRLQEPATCPYPERTSTGSPILMDICQIPLPVGPFIVVIVTQLATHARGGWR